LTKNLEELQALIGLKMCDGIGDITANKLLNHCGSATAVFKEKSKHLSSIQGVSVGITEVLNKGVNWKRVDKELEFILKNKINTVSILDPIYPKKLAQTDAAPTLLFFKGNISVLNTSPCISIVGTRTPTHYGMDAVESIITELKNMGVVVISGLALGIDVAAHKSCLTEGVLTFGIVGHGLKTVYPSHHEPVAQEMISAGGGIISEFFSDMIPNRENFPKRNRIIAGLSGATIVIEASKKSGTIITAEYALGYKRKVFALPGRINDKLSEGCNFLLKNSAVKPIVSVIDLIDELGIKKSKKSTIKPVVQINLNTREKLVIELLSSTTKMRLDDLVAKSQMNVGECSNTLLNLEMMGLVKPLPGKVYELG